MVQNADVVNSGKFLYRYLFLLGALSAISICGYLLFSYTSYGIGFPLDDAWIHQTYARNLVYHHEWAFIPGQHSAGSTAPLWTFILSIGYFFNISPYVWTFFLGFILLSMAGIFGIRAYSLCYPQKQKWSLWVGILLVLEWHLVWAASSGMETLLCAVIYLIFFISLLIKNRNWLLSGLLIGLSIWIRPDGITLLIPGIFTSFMVHSNWKKGFQCCLVLVAGFLLLFTPYLWFNYSISAHIWPNTFYAKQIEYSIMMQLPLYTRILGEVKTLSVGVGALLLPGLFLSFFYSVRLRKWVQINIIIWIICYIGLYAWRLPVTYQHGRYLIPVIPTFIIMSLFGVTLWIEPFTKIPSRRILSRIWVLSIGMLSIAYWILGGFAYGRDVAFIESEMVTTARWISNHTKPNAVIAAHDIGALGYFCNRKLIDLAGLISPEVINFIRDEYRLKEYLDKQDIDYLVAFPSWYTLLTIINEPIYQSTGIISPEMGGENLVVYPWK